MPSSPLASPSATRAALERYGLATKHGLGQNFLVDDNVVRHILELARPGDADAVVEVGPGLGTLTHALLDHAGSVTSIEADRELEPVLADIADERRGFSFVMGDALRVGPGDVAAANGGTPPTMLVSNLPYNVAATIILATFEGWPSVRSATVMVQAEVADRICAVPGGRTYGAYTAKLALRARVTGRFEVSPRCFMPAPHVDSAVVRIERKAMPGCDGEPLGVRGLAGVSRVIDAAFAQRRKTIRNSMAASGFGKPELDEAFAAAGIAPAARAETLAPTDFVRLATALGL